MRISLPAAFCIVFFASCNPVVRTYVPPPPKYNSEITPGVNLHQYRTFAYLPTQDTGYAPLVDKPQFEKALADAAVNELKQRGMSTDTVNPDCLLTYTLVLKRAYDVDRPKQVVYSPQVYDPNYGRQGYVYYWGASNKPSVYDGKIKITTLREGSLVLDLIDRKDNKVIWRSSMESTRQEKNYPDMTRLVPYIIPEMFKKFPAR